MERAAGATVAAVMIEVTRATVQNPAGQSPPETEGLPVKVDPSGVLAAAGVPRRRAAREEGGGCSEGGGGARSVRAAGGWRR